MEEYLKINRLKNRYVTDGNIWTIDETIFNSKTIVFLVVNLKTRAIIGYILHPDCQNEDLIIELYERILEQYTIGQEPIYIHSDLEPTFVSKEVRDFLEEHKIEISSTLGEKNQNQVSEAINESIKSLVAEILIEKENKGLKAWRKTMSSKYKSWPKKKRIRNKDFRKELFESDYFHTKRWESIEEAIFRYNQRSFSNKSKVTRRQAEYYNSKLQPRQIDNVQLVRSDDLLAQKVLNENVVAIEQAELEIKMILQAETSIETKMTQIALLTINEQSQTKELLKKGFSGLALQNVELLNQNKDLKEQLELLQKQLLRATELLEEMQRERFLKEENKRLRKNRKIQPKRDPMNLENYLFFISESERIKNKYLKARLRIAITLLFITGVRISELLPLRVSQVKTLFAEGWIAIDRSKRGHSSYKAFLTPEGFKIIKARKKDFEILLFFKDDESFIFTAENSNKPLARGPFNRLINQFIKQISQDMPNKPNLTSHSFRIGFITKLWRDTGDIEFVRQAIGHAKIETTSLYVENLSDEERRIRMQKLDNTDDLFIH